MTTEKELIPFSNESLPVLEFNFDEIKKELTTEMQKYDGMVVTLETMKADKKLAQELKAKGKKFNQQRIDKVKEISKPIEKFTEQMNELKAICEKSAKVISDQVEVFEKEALVDIEKQIDEHLSQCRISGVVRVQPDFMVEGVAKGLTKLTAVTSKGALTKATKDKIAAVVAEEVALQGKVEYRLLQLESESHKANLHTPLVRLNVESFLFESDEVYQEKLAEVVQSELQRQKLADENKAAQVEPEQNETVDKLRESAGVAERLAEKFADVPNHPDTLEGVKVVHQDLVEDNASQDFNNATYDQYDAYAEQMMQEQSQHQQEPAIQLKDGHVMCIATAVFKVSVPRQVSEEMVEQKLIDMMSKAGIESLDSVKVTKHA